MVDRSSGAIRRTIRIHTNGGTIDGVIQSSIMVRLLDDLNLNRSFITVQEPETQSGRWPAGEGAVSIRRSTILFVRELSVPPPRPGNPSAAFEGHFSRARVSFQVGDCSMTGWLHVPLKGSAIAQLQRESHPFVALTEVFAEGPDGNFEAAFLAVHRDRILAVREHGVEDPLEAEETLETAVPSAAGDED